VDEADIGAGLTAISAARLLEETEFERASISGLQLGDADLAGKRFAGCRIVRTALAAADLRKTTFDDVSLEDCDLSSVRLDGASLSDVTFRRCKLLGVDWSGTTRSLIGQPLVFEACQLDFGVFQTMNLRRSVFRDCSAREADFVGADISQATFQGTNLERARFGGTRLVDTDLVEARGYELDPRENDVRGLRLGLPDGAALLRVFGIVIDGD
jgi:fluoroquinolone resistance protein